MGHMCMLATAADIMPYTPNNDTVYSGAFLELADGPVILTAPDIADRYWSVEVADAYTNNLFYIGTRATGGKGGNHAFVGPDWHGTLPKNVIEHRVPTNTAMFAIRIGVVPQDHEDLLKVNALQEEFNLTSLRNGAMRASSAMRRFLSLPNARIIGEIWLTFRQSPIYSPKVLKGRRGRCYPPRPWRNHIGQPFEPPTLDEAAQRGSPRRPRRDDRS